MSEKIRSAPMISPRTIRAGVAGQMIRSGTRYISTGAVAMALGIAARTAAKLIDTGEIDAIRIVTDRRALVGSFLEFARRHGIERILDVPTLRIAYFADSVTCLLDVHASMHGDAVEDNIDWIEARCIGHLLDLTRDRLPTLAIIDAAQTGFSSALNLAQAVVGYTGAGVVIYPPDDISPENAVAPERVALIRRPSAGDELLAQVAEFTRGTP